MYQGKRKRKRDRNEVYTGNYFIEKNKRKTIEHNNKLAAQEAGE